MAKLKRCPFCGSPAEIHEREGSSTKCVNSKSEVPEDANIILCTEYPNAAKYRVFYEYREILYIPRCSRTECAGRLAKTFRSEAKAAEAWNRRAARGE